MLHGRYLGGSVITILVLIVAFQVGTSSAIAPLPKGEERCTGLEFDLSRLRSLSGSQAEDVQPATGGTTSYKMNQVMPIKISDTLNENGETKVCVVQRLRLYEQMNGVPIYGADTVVTLDDCYEEVAEAGSNIATYSLTQQVEEDGLKGLSIHDISGKTFTSVHVKTGYVPKHSKETVTNFLAKEYDVDQSSRDMGEPKLNIFPSKDGDYLAYFVKLLIQTIEGGASTTKAIRVIVDAETLDILSTCLLTVSPLHQKRRNIRHLRKLQDGLESRNLSAFCTSCGINRTISLTSATTTQQIRSLYLTNTGKNAEVTEATVIADGSTINVPGPVSSLYWEGTYHCFDQTDTSACSLVELPTTCDDALSDVQYVAVETLRFLQSDLNVLGGLAVSSSSPQSVVSGVHYDQGMCNAFYFQNTLIFGDCDCVNWTPLVAMDVVAHELSHGVTEKSSNLDYYGQSGGLNEGYADILGTVIEYAVDDSTDTPDFLIGERLEGSRGPLRYMENPPDDGVSIGSACDFYSDLDVHYSSGVPNKAMVKSARACEANSCSTSERECALLIGKLFSYANIYRLSTFSNYLDAASNTCSVISEFFTQTSPTTSCSQSEVQSFITDGWSSVSINVDGSCTATNNCGPTPSPGPPPLTMEAGCNTATSISLGSSISADTTGTPATFTDQCFTAYSLPSSGVWYSVQGNGEGIVASLCTNTVYDTMISVWSGTCASLTCVGGTDDSCWLQSSVSWTSSSSLTYYIFVHGYAGATGSYTLSVSSTGPTPTPVDFPTFAPAPTPPASSPTCAFSPIPNWLSGIFRSFGFDG